MAAYCNGRCYCAGDTRMTDRTFSWSCSDARCCKGGLSVGIGSRGRQLLSNNLTEDGKWRWNGKMLGGGRSGNIWTGHICRYAMRTASTVSPVNPNNGI